MGHNGGNSKHATITHYVRQRRDDANTGGEWCYDPGQWQGLPNCSVAPAPLGKATTEQSALFEPLCSVRSVQSTPADHRAHRAQYVYTHSTMNT